MSGRGAAVLAWGLLAAYLAVEVVVVLLVVFRDGTPDELFSLVVVVYAIAGSVVASRRRDNPIGWLLLTVALAFGLQSLGETIVSNPDNVGAAYVGWLGSLMWNVWLSLSTAFLILVFPTGRLPSPRWRPVAWGILAGLLFNTVVTAVFPGDLGLSAPMDNPVGWAGGRELLEPLRAVGVGVAVVSVLVSAASIVPRFRRSRGTERQQLKWFALAGLVGAAGLTIAAVVALVPGGWRDGVGAVGWGLFLVAFLIGLPVTVAIAVLRHRLFDIDVVIKRTLVYGSLTVLLLGTYLLFVLTARLMVSPLTRDSDFAVAASTLAVAALFRPLRTRVQSVVDRRFYRSRYDASRTLSTFAASLRDELDLETLGHDLRGVVRDTMQPVHVSLWLREAAR